LKLHVITPAAADSDDAALKTAAAANRMTALVPANNFNMMLSPSTPPHFWSQHLLLPGESFVIQRSVKRFTPQGFGQTEKEYAPAGCCG